MLMFHTEPTPTWTDLLHQQSFTWSAFQFTLQANERSFLPEYKDSTLRGGFGHSFRKVCCTMQWDQPCQNCMRNQTCPYACIFAATFQIPYSEFEPGGFWTRRALKARQLFLPVEIDL